MYISKLTKKSGDTVEGIFQNGQPHGECIVHYADGSKFKGIFKNGKRNGAAIEENKDGKRFEGSYSDDLGDGKFIEKDRNGKVIVEVYMFVGIDRLNNDKIYFFDH